MTKKQFCVAFSFADEIRAFVEEVVQRFAKRFGEAAVLYDSTTGQGFLAPTATNRSTRA